MYNSSYSDKQGAKMKLEIGTQITWVSAAGKLSGTIKNIVLAKNAADKVVPWIDVVYGQDRGARLCATDSNLKQLKVQYLKLETV
jgi:hypothetical protein